jgi:hypothetical protein
METWRHGDIDTQRHRDMEMETRNMETLRHEKLKMEAKAIFHNPFTVCSSVKRKFVCLLKEETNESYLFCKRTKGTKRTCPSLVILYSFIIAMIFFLAALLVVLLFCCVDYRTTAVLPLYKNICNSTGIAGQRSVNGLLTL